MFATCDMCAFLIQQEAAKIPGIAWYNRTLPPA